MPQMASHTLRAGESHADNFGAGRLEDSVDALPLGGNAFPAAPSQLQAWQK